MFSTAPSPIKTFYFFILFFLFHISISSSLERLCHQCLCSNESAVLNCSTKIFDLASIENCTEITRWQTVDFSRRNLQTFDSSELCSIRTQRLILNSNSMRKISNSTFDSLGGVLVELDLADNQLASLSSTWLNSKLEHLEKLNLASNRIESLADVQLDSLRELNLSNNFIASFPSEIRHWTSLTTLDLSFNQLSSVPRFALMGLNNLTWLSLASNRNLSCLIQDSFKYLKSLLYLDLSSTNLHHLDACIFVQLSSLQTLRIENIPMNCTSCWLLIARENALQITGHCRSNGTLHPIATLTADHLEQTCAKTSIDCSKDYCDPGRMSDDERALIHLQNKSSSLFQTSTILFILGMVFLAILVASLLGFYRWKTKQQLFCCRLPSRSTTIAEATRRRREHRKQIISDNPAVIESVVTHGANMNVPAYPCQNGGYFHDETSKHKRKLYNPMFGESATAADARQRESNDDDTSSNNEEFYSERL